MRWLFLFVLSLNVVYIAWQVTGSDAPSPDAAKSEMGGVVHSPAKNGIKSIVLLSEQEKLQESQRDKYQIESTDVVSQVATQSEEQVSAQEGLAQNNVATQAEVMSKEGEEVRPEVAVEEESAIIDSPPLESNTCFTVGPFHELGELRRFVKDIKTYVTKAEFRSVEEKELTVYWVYIKPEKSRRDARKLGEQLKAKKVKDFYIIRSGENNNGLSLGHFKNKYRAAKLTKKIKKLGFDVVLEPVFKAFDVYWLDYELPGDKKIPQEVFDKYIKLAKNGKITRLNRDCAIE